MPRILYLSCEVPFPVWTPDDISGLISVAPWLSRGESSKEETVYASIYSLSLDTKVCTKDKIDMILDNVILNYHLIVNCQ